MRQSSKTPRTFRATGIVLKRRNVGETDRLVTFLSQQQGKFTAVAKGVRKLTSSKQSYIETGNYLAGYFVVTQSLPLLTQAKLIDDCAVVRTSLPTIRKLTQFLEIVERLFVEEELEQHVFDQILQLRAGIVSQTASAGQIKKQLGTLIEQLGYQHPEETHYHSLLDYVAVLADRPMRSFEYLAVKS